MYRENNPHLAAALPPTPTAELDDAATEISEATLEPVVKVSASRQCAIRILSTRKFSSLIHFCIIANTVTVALEQSSRLMNNEMPVLNALEHGFIFFFLLELLLRFFAERSKALCNGWIWFDFFLVSVAVTASWIFPNVDLASRTGDPHSALGVALVLRAARLARVVRAVRLVRQLSHLWSLVHALLTSTRMIGYVFVVVALVLHVFNSMALELITLRYMNRPDVPEHIREIVDHSFSSVGSSMLTLVQFLCFDSIAAVYRPLAEYDFVLAVYFMLVVMVVGIVLMNVITASIVNTALNQSNEDRELVMERERQHKEKLVDKLYGVFVSLDTDSTGQLSLAGLMSICGEDAKLLAEFLGNRDPQDIFRMLDVDRCGHMPIYEFCEGLYEVVVGESRVELRNIMRHVDRISDHLCANREALARIEAALLQDKERAAAEEGRRMDELYLRRDNEKHGKCLVKELMAIRGDGARLRRTFSGGMDPTGPHECREGTCEVRGQPTEEQRGYTTPVHHIVDTLASNRKLFAKIQADLQKVILAMGQDDGMFRTMASSIGNSCGRVPSLAPAVEPETRMLACKGTPTFQPARARLSLERAPIFRDEAPVSRRSAGSPPGGVGSTLLAHAEDANAVPAVRVPASAERTELFPVTSGGGRPRLESPQPSDDGSYKTGCSEESVPMPAEFVHRRVFEWL